MAHTEPREGFTYRTPDGCLGWACHDSESQAITSASMAFNGRGCCELPKDWKLAQEAGWTIVPVIMAVKLPAIGCRASSPAFSRGGL